MGAVCLRSGLDVEQALEYRWRWFDVDGFEQDVPEDRWRSLRVRPFGDVQVHGRAPLPEAIRGELELRLGPRS